MTSVSGSALGASTLQTRRLSVLPAVLGLASILLFFITGQLAGIFDGSSLGRPLVLVAVACLITTIISGHPVGIYVGMVVFVIAALSGDEPMSTRSMVVSVVGMVIVHEVARGSLDARRPARFGGGLWLRYGIRTVAVCAVVAAAALLSADVTDLSLPNWLVPVGLVVGSLPLLTRRLMTGRSTTADPNGPSIGPSALRVGLGLLIAATAVTGSILGATARSEIENIRPASIERAEPTPDETVQEPLVQLDDAAMVERGVAILLFFITMLVVGFLYIALKRPEVTFDLDDLDMDLDESNLAFAGPGQADLDEDVEIDERELVKLLDDLALDISAERDPGRAIRFAYANVERRLGDMGVVRPESETEQEFLTRALPSLGPQGDAMVSLTSLFEQARFGHLPMTEPMRARALDAVQILRDATKAAEPDPEPEAKAEAEAGATVDTGVPNTVDQAGMTNDSDPADGDTTNGAGNE